MPTFHSVLSQLFMPHTHTHTHTHAHTHTDMQYIHSYSIKPVSVRLHAYPPLFMAQPWAVVAQHATASELYGITCSVKERTDVFDCFEQFSTNPSLLSSRAGVT